MPVKSEVVLVGAVALGLVAAITLELRAGTAHVGAASADAGGLLPSPRRAATVVPNRADEWVATILARPVFSPARRPPQVVAAAADGPRELPRLSGILVSRGRRAAIFAGSGEQKPIVANLGSQVGEDVVQSIEPNRVILRGPEGEKILRPAYAAKEAAGGAGASEQPRARALRGRRGEGETSEQAADLGR